MGIVGLFLIPILDILSIIINLYFKVVVVDIVLYWMLNYKLITVHNKYAEKFMDILHKITEPVYAVVRKKVRPVSGYDVAPYVLLLGIIFVNSFISHLSSWMNTYM